MEPAGQPRRRAADTREVDALLVVLQAELAPDTYTRVQQAVSRMESAMTKHFLSELEDVVEAITQHFPAFAPAIRAVAHHARGADAGRCRDHCAHPYEDAVLALFDARGASTPPGF